MAAVVVVAGCGGQNSASNKENTHVEPESQNTNGTPTRTGSADVVDTHADSLASVNSDSLPTLLSLVLDIKDERRFFHALALGDGEYFNKFLGARLACNALSGAVTRMRAAPAPENFVPTDFSDFCEERLLSPRSLGNPEHWDVFGSIEQTPWTLTPGTAIDIGVKSIKNNYQPYMRKVRYKTFENANGSLCKLEMRIYKKDVSQNNLKTMIAFHGGSWTYRGAGFTGLETYISHFTESNFVVFVPFYRLLNDLDGNEACNNVSGEQIVQDVNDALDWVQLNAESFGGVDKPVLFGQSAGAHLSAYLAIHRPNDIKRSWLFYPPTDMTHFIRSSFDHSASSSDLGVVRNYFHRILAGRDLKDIDFDNDFLRKNSFPSWLQDHPQITPPPMFIMHGVKDKSVPSLQSVRLCNALSGAQSLGQGVAMNEGGDVSASYFCSDNGSVLHVFSEADHMMDLACIEGLICPGGNRDSAKAIEQTIDVALAWLNR